VKRLPPLGPVQAFVEVARLGSLKAAAESLALSPPALTRRIQSLEQFVGQPLLERHPNGVQLNLRGRALLQAIGPHLDALANAVDRVTDGGGAMRIRIAVPSLFGSQRLMPALPSLRRLHPELMVDVDTGVNRVSRLGEDIDAAIIISTAVADQYYSRMLERGETVAIASRSLVATYPMLKDPSGLAEVPVLLHREMAGAFEDWKDGAGYPDLRPAHINYFDAGQLILDAAAAGLGVAFMLRSHLESSADGRLVQLFPETTPSPYAYWFACPPSSLERRAVRIFHDWLFSQFGEEMTGHRSAAA